jgi:uncharacterized protein YjbI with pentapeptide repeats
LLCIGYNIHGLVIKDKKFTKAVYFNHAIFSGDIVIENNSFQSASFAYSQFDCGVIKFPKNEFNGRKTDFSNCIIIAHDVFFATISFEGDQLSFLNSKFTADSIDFTDTKFSSKLINFSYAEFSTSLCAIYFTNTLFAGQTYFTNCKFCGKDLVIFGGAEFTGNIISFGGTQFLGRGVTFTRAKFSNAEGIVGFPDTIFDCEEVSFHRAQFCCEAQFLRSIFKVKKRLDFDYTKFLKKCSFGESSFSGRRASFIRTAFEDELSFREVEFESIIFEEAQFAKTDFTNSKFRQNALFSNCNFNDVIQFNYVEFEEPDNVIFQTNDLSNISLINTDVTRVVFSESAKFGIGSQRFKTYDERMLEDVVNKKLKDNNIKLGELLALYRNLRENYEYRLRYEEAGQFFVREMELKRNYKEVEEVDNKKK